MKVNQFTVVLLSSVLEIAATARSVLATYAVAMVVFNGDQTLSIFTVAVIEGALVLSMLGIGLDPVSPITAIIALAFSAVMQYVEVATLTGQLTAEEKNWLVLSLSFAPTVLLALGILRRLSGSASAGVLDSISSFFGGLFGAPKSSSAKSFDASRQSWTETRRVKRWRDASGRKRSKSLPSGQRRKK